MNRGWERDGTNPRKIYLKIQVRLVVEIWRTDPLRSGLKYQATLSLIPHGTLSLSPSTRISPRAAARVEGHDRPPGRRPPPPARPPARRPGPPAPPAGPARRRPRPLSPFPAAPPARRTRLEAALLAGGRARPPAGPLPRSSARRCPNPRGGRGCGGGSKGKLVRFCLPSGLRFTGS